MAAFSYFFPIGLPHFGHFNAENLNPGFGGTGVLQAGQIPYVSDCLDLMIDSELKLGPSWLKLLDDLTGL